jgi:hypothetical protein
MIYRLEVENFFSIRERQVLDLTIDGKVPDEEGRYAPIFAGAEHRAPKVVAFYGANASGKTTALRALQFVANMVRFSVTNPNNQFFGLERFNDTESANRPARFAVEFGGIVNLSEDIRTRTDNGERVDHGTYRYELAIEFKDGIATGIRSEALRQKPKGQGKWQRVYERTAEGRVKGSGVFYLSGFRHLERTLAPNHTVLSSYANFQHPIANLIVDSICVFFPNEPVNSFDDNTVIKFLKDYPKVFLRLGSELSRIDVGVEAMLFEQTNDGPVLKFRHSGLELAMPWFLESHGTRAFIKIYPFIMLALDHGGVAVIDEMDAAIHPKILPELVRWFYKTSGRNERDAQLWLSCHAASLLDDLNKEEIVICEKDSLGRTSIHSLMDVKVRRDENHYRKYLSGAYGGVPNLG